MPAYQCLINCGLNENGDPGVTRTRNILLRRQVLYPVELRGLKLPFRRFVQFP